MVLAQVLAAATVESRVLNEVTVARVLLFASVFPNQLPILHSEQCLRLLLWRGYVIPRCPELLGDYSISVGSQ